MRMSQSYDSIPTRSTLLRRLKDWNDQVSWQFFSDTYGSLIYKIAVTAGLNHHEAEDACQSTYISAMHGLRTFDYDRNKGSFKSWLLQLALWRIRDQIAKRDRHLAGDLSAETSTRTATVERQANGDESEFELMWDEEWKSELIRRAADRVKRKVDAAHYQVFDLLFFKNWPPAKTAAFTGMSIAQVYLIKHRITKLMEEAVGSLRDTLI